MEWYKKPVLVRVHSAYVMLPFLWCRSLMNVCSSKFPSSWLKFYKERKTNYNYSIYWTGCVEFEFIKAISMIIIYLLKKWLCSALSLGGHIFGLLFFSCILLCIAIMSSIQSNRFYLWIKWIKIRQYSDFMWSFIMLLLSILVLYTSVLIATYCAIVHKCLWIWYAMCVTECDKNKYY